MQNRQQQEVQEWAQEIAKQVEEGVNGILRNIADDLAAKSGEANEELLEELDWLITEEDALIDRMDDDISLKMRKIKQVKQAKQHALQALTDADSEVSACDQYKIDTETGGFWVCDADKLKCEMSDSYWDDWVSAAEWTGETEEELEESARFMEDFVSQAYAMVCNMSDEAWYIEWVLKKKEMKKRTQEDAAIATTDADDSCQIDLAIKYMDCYNSCGSEDWECQD